METFICKCCLKDTARWCGEGPDACLNGNDCDHIHCDNCGMHYSLESKESLGAETGQDARALMVKAYGGVFN